jgi:hypothetical protein
MMARSLFAFSSQFMSRKSIFQYNVVRLYKIGMNLSCFEYILMYFSSFNSLLGSNIFMLYIAS